MRAKRLLEHPFDLLDRSLRHHAAIGPDDDSPPERRALRQQRLIERFEPLRRRGEVLRLRALAPLPHLAASAYHRCS